MDDDVLSAYLSCAAAKHIGAQVPSLSVAEQEIEFKIVAKPVLVSGRESAPYMSVYVVCPSMVVLGPVFSERCERIARERLAHTAAEWKVYTRVTAGDKKPALEEDTQSISSISCTAQYVLPKDVIAADCILCVQMFCRIANSRGELCAHKCGFLMAALSTMAIGSTGPLRLVDNARWASTDWRSGAATNRGEVTVSASPSTAQRIKSRAGTGIIAAFNTLRDATIQQTKNYLAERERVSASYISSESYIRPVFFPVYAFAGCAGPPTLFADVAMFPGHPMDNTNTTVDVENWILSALDICMRRRAAWESSDLSPFAFPSIGASPSEDALLQRYIYNSDWNTLSSLFVDVCMLVSQTCPYLLDVEARAAMDGLDPADEFSRTMRSVLSGDCEDDALDGAYTAKIIALGALHKKWQSKVLYALAAVRAVNVSVLALKMVTVASACNSSGRGRTAHASFDLIPILSFKKILGSDAPVGNWRRELIQLSGLSFPGTATRITVGEGTGYVPPINPKQAQPKLCRSHIKQLFGELEAYVRVSCLDDTTQHNGSRFYTHCQGILVLDDDMGSSSRELLVLDKETKHVGVRHHVFVDIEKNSDNVILAPFPKMHNISDENIQKLLCCDHPMPTLGCTGAVPATDRAEAKADCALIVSSLSLRMTKATAAAANKRAGRANPLMSSSRTPFARTNEALVPIVCTCRASVLTPKTVLNLSESVESDAAIFDFRCWSEVVCDGVTNVGMAFLVDSAKCNEL